MNHSDRVHAYINALEHITKWEQEKELIESDLLRALNDSTYNQYEWYTVKGKRVRVFIEKNKKYILKDNALEIIIRKIPYQYLEKVILHTEEPNFAELKFLIEAGKVDKEILDECYSVTEEKKINYKVLLPRMV